MTSGDNNDRVGCGIYLGIGLLAMLVSGFCGARIGRLIQPASEYFSGQLTFIAGSDALLIVAICYSSRVQKNLPNPLTAALSFAAIGFMCGRGNGVAWMAVWGIINSLVTLVAFPLWHYQLKSKNQ